MEKHFVQTQWGVSALDYFSFTNEEEDKATQEFIVFGEENGQIHVYDYTKNKSQSYNRNIFSV